MEWLKFTLIEKPFYDPRTGEVLDSIEGRRNRKNVDPFEGGGVVFPEIPRGLQVKEWFVNRPHFMVLVEGQTKDVSSVLSESKEMYFRASPKVITKYSYQNHKPTRVTKPLEELKKTIGLPEGTTLDENLEPIIPEETIK